jgi:hypothetical protein
MTSLGECWKNLQGEEGGEWGDEVVELGELKVSKNDGNLDFLG